ncbi:MAG: hypothetical protein M0Z65_14370 [Firmicutes bacterium]|uniref:DoxX protein n=1 Tax=Melghirimyces thermohalophilus TaxID=1236220 RepID=A0A1G6Q7Q5_9BACL|nr:hypothetical protein [Melghirimyces thermohalophilus]MDA8354334.1 hypothetical protein [Bacillota bacterium]SDC88251.1 hypothetical protein SAMN04488112_12018 [Melghirimyces thermohalophilus]
MNSDRWVRVLKQSVPTTMRLYLGVIFLIYGLAKLYPGQFGVPSPKVASINGEGFVVAWTFFGYSRAYEIMIGLGETLSALLIMFPRTATLGAICYFPIVINVTMVNYFYDIGVQNLSTVMTIMCVILLWLDRGKLMLLLNRRPNTTPEEPHLRKETSGI